MKSLLLFILTVPDKPAVFNRYFIGAIVALLVFVYLMYTLFKPEKF